MSTTTWPRLPIQPEHLPLIRELLTAEEYEKLLKRNEVSTLAAGASSLVLLAGWLRLLFAGP